MNLPLVNVFSTPYEAWTTRNATLEEMHVHIREHGHVLPFVNDTLKARISNHFDAAIYMSNNVADNGLENFIDSYLDRDASYRTLRQAMPPKTPAALFDFQQRYPNFSALDVDREINNIGHTLSEGQCLFHGGLWANNLENTVTLTSPFSTSLCPQVALRNAEWRGKAYDAGQIDLFVLRAEDPRTNVFSFRRKGAKMGNEKEVLFASGAKLTLQRRTLVGNNFSVGKYNHSSKNIPIFVIEVGVS